MSSFDPKYFTHDEFYEDLTDDMRVKILDLLEHTFLGMRMYGLCPNVPTPPDEGATYEEQVTFQLYMANIGRILHNVPSWLAVGRIPKGSFDWLMAQRAQGRLT